MNNKNEQLAMHVSWVCIVGNVILSAAKLAAGVIGNSAAMISDAAHSLSDVLSTVFVMIGIKLSNKRPDKEHPYGHERLECVAAVILAAILFATGIGIGYSGLSKINSSIANELSIPGVSALAAALASIIIKEAMYWYTRSAAVKIDSSALMADAWHHRSDALSSIGSFAGILGARMGFPILDPIACVIICVFIIIAAYKIFMDAIGKMTDKSCDDKVLEEIRSIILEQNDVVGIDQVRTRMFGDKIYVDVEIRANGNASLNETHTIAHNVHDAIESRLQKVKHCMVHVNPAETDL